MHHSFCLGRIVFVDFEGFLYFPFCSVFDDGYCLFALILCSVFALAGTKVATFLHLPDVFVSSFYNLSVCVAHKQQLAEGISYMPGF